MKAEVASDGGRVAEVSDVIEVVDGTEVNIKQMNGTPDLYRELSQFDKCVQWCRDHMEELGGDFMISGRSKDDCRICLGHLSSPSNRLDLIKSWFGGLTATKKDSGLSTFDFSVVDPGTGIKFSWCQWKPSENRSSVSEEVVI